MKNFVKVTIEACQVKENEDLCAERALKFGGSYVLVHPIETMEQYWKIDSAVHKAVEQFQTQIPEMEG